MKQKLIEFKRRHLKYIEKCYAGSTYIGYIFQDSSMDYLFKKGLFVTSCNIGKGKCLEVIAKRLIELNYKK